MLVFLECGYVFGNFRGRLKAAQLQNYWKKICENEKKSNWRNEQMVKDFERVESQMASLSARTERLRTMKVWQF